MTGGEIAAGAAAAKAAAQQALKTSESEQERLADIAGADHPAMVVAADAYARRVALKQGIVARLYESLARLVGIRDDYFVEGFGKDLGEKTAHIPDEHMQSPPPTVAVPAMQALGYSLDEPTLKEMYLNLLATATDDRSAEDVHPSFADVIRQLTPQEAAPLLEVLPRLDRHMPIMQIRRREEGSEGFKILGQHILPLLDDETGEFAPAEKVSIWVDNWLRLGLVTVEYDRWIVAADAYEWCETHPNMVKWRQTAAEGESFEVQKGVLSQTAYGRRFARAVTPDPRAVVLITEEATADAGPDEEDRPEEPSA